MTTALLLHFHQGDGGTVSNEGT